MALVGATVDGATADSRRFVSDGAIALDEGRYSVTVRDSHGTIRSAESCSAG